MTQKKGTLAMISWILLIIGGLNWGLVGIGQLIGGRDWNVVGLIFNSWAPWLAAIVYILVGIAALVLLFGGDKMCCKAPMQSQSNPVN